MSVHRSVRIAAENVFVWIGHHSVSGFVMVTDRAEEASNSNSEDRLALQAARLTRWEDMIWYMLPVLFRRTIVEGVYANPPSLYGQPSMCLELVSLITS